jgi:hypothetical protein
VNQYPNCKLTFLEVPHYSIVRWNITRGHRQPEVFATQDNTLHEQIEAINQAIHTLNRKLLPLFTCFLALRCTVKRGDLTSCFLFNVCIAWLMASICSWRVLSCVANTSGWRWPIASVYISLAFSETNDAITVITNLFKQFIDLVNQYPNCKLTFLEVPHYSSSLDLCWLSFQLKKVRKPFVGHRRRHGGKWER